MVIRSVNHITYDWLSAKFKDWIGRRSEHNKDKILFLANFYFLDIIEQVLGN